jgi:hypothetical protein
MGHPHPLHHGPPSPPPHTHTPTPLSTTPQLSFVVFRYTAPRLGQGLYCAAMGATDFEALPPVFTQFHTAKTVALAEGTMTVSRGGTLVSAMATFAGLPPAMDSAHVITKVAVDSSVPGVHRETWTRYFTPAGSHHSFVFETTQVGDGGEALRVRSGKWGTVAFPGHLDGCDWNAPSVSPGPSSPPPPPHTHTSDLTSPWTLQTLEGEFLVEATGPLAFVFHLVPHEDRKGFDHLLVGVRLRVPLPLPRRLWGEGAGLSLPRWLWPRVTGTSTALPGRASEGWYASVSVHTPALLRPFLGDLVLAYSGVNAAVSGDWPQAAAAADSAHTP